MRALLDVNFLVALLDVDHIFHKISMDWFKTNESGGWASCAITQNGFVRVSSNTKYSGLSKFSITDSIDQLGKLIDETDHQFWSDQISILDTSIFASDRIHGPRQLTDIYLLALATKKHGRLVTFDQNIPLSAVHGARPENLYVL